jgi:hypothetical protein
LLGESRDDGRDHLVDEWCGATDLHFAKGRVR